MTIDQKTCDAGKVKDTANADSKEDCADMQVLKDIGALAGDIRAVATDKARQAVDSAATCMNKALHSSAGAVEDAAARMKEKTATKD